MKNKYGTSLPQFREIEENVADLWLSTGAIRIMDIGEENTYYSNEFGHLFFCKNYPAALPICGSMAIEFAEESGCSYSDSLVYCNID